MSTQETCSICSTLRCRQYAPAALVAVVGLSVTLAIFWTAYRWERHSIDHHFESLAEDRVQGIDTMFREAARLVNFMDDVFQVGPRPDSPEFVNYVRSLKSLLESDMAKHWEVHSLIWAPRVPDADRAAYERAGQAVLDPRFRLGGADGSEKKSSDTKRDACYPCYLCLGKTLLRDRVGDNLALDPAMWAVMQQARDTDQPVAGAPIKMSADANSRVGYRVFKPLYSKGDPRDVEARRKACAGFLCLELDVGEMVDVALKNIRPVGIEIRLVDETDGNQVTVSEHRSRLVSSCAGKSGGCLAGELSTALPAEFFGRKMSIRCRTTDVFWASRTIWQPWALLLAGLGLTAFGVVQRINSARNASEIERMVSTRLAKIQREVEHRREIEGR